MSLPRRTHYSVFEVMNRWGTTITDMRCYLETGRLQAQVLLDARHAQVYRRLETPDGEEAWVKKSIITLHGYVVIQPDQLRRIFCLKATPIHKFRAIEGTDYYKLLREKDICAIGIEDIWIAHEESKRFEAAYNLPASMKQTPANDSKTGIAATSSGRPSIMKRITERHQERVAHGEALPTIAAEAQVLRSWARGTMPGVQIPSAKTIQNRLSVTAG